MKAFNSFRGGLTGKQKRGFVKQFEVKLVSPAEAVPRQHGASNVEGKLSTKTLIQSKWKKQTQLVAHQVIMSEP